MDLVSEARVAAWWIADAARDARDFGRAAQLYDEPLSRSLDDPAIQFNGATCATVS
jgi:hypothetical protein